MRREERTFFQEEDGKEGKSYKITDVIETIMDEEEWVNHVNNLLIKQQQINNQLMAYSGMIRQIEEKKLMPKQFKKINTGEKSE